MYCATTPSSFKIFSALHDGTMTIRYFREERRAPGKGQRRAGEVVRSGDRAKIPMHGLNLPGIPRSRGEKEHDVAVDEGGASDAPDCRLGSYGGEGRNHHGRHPASKPDDYRHTRRRRLLSRISWQELTLHGHAGKINGAIAARRYFFPPYVPLNLVYPSSVPRDERPFNPSTHEFKPLARDNKWKALILPLFVIRVSRHVLSFFTASV